METKLLEANCPADIACAVGALRRDEVVAIPTETVYGLAGNAFSTRALARIFGAKERPSFDPLILHVWADSLPHPSVSWLADDLGIVDRSVLTDADERTVDALLKAFWPGPLTVVIPKTSRVPDLATSGRATVALRMPAHPTAQALLQAMGGPLAAPSANRFGRISPTCSAHVFDELNGRIGWIVDGGACRVGVESTIVALTGRDRPPVLLRPGGVSQQALAEVLGFEPCRMSTVPGNNDPAAPGMLDSHYAPRKRLHMLPDDVMTLHDEQLRHVLGPSLVDVGLLRVVGETAPIHERLQRLYASPPAWLDSLSPSGDLEHAARRLFARLRDMDADAHAHRIFVEPCLETSGLGYAIQDRLARAAAPRRRPVSK